MIVTLKTARGDLFCLAKIFGRTEAPIIVLHGHRAFVRDGSGAASYRETDPAAARQIIAAATPQPVSLKTRLRARLAGILGAVS